MLGLNEKHTGVWNSEDITFSQSIESKTERVSAELARADERLKEMWPLKLLKHTIKKILLNFNDGSFAWGIEGSFWLETYNLNSPVSDFFKEIFYFGSHSTGCANTHKIWINLTQALWISCLFFSLFSSSPSFDVNNTIIVTKLACIGIFLFNMLFEARARYIFTFVPIFIFLSTSGIENFIAIVRNSFNKIKNR